MNNRPVFRTILSIFSTNIFVIVLVAAGGIILPRLLNPHALGRLNSLTALAAIIYSFTFLGMRSSLLIHLGKHQFEPEKILRALAYIYVLSVILSTLSLLFFFIFLSADRFSCSLVLLVCLINPFEFLISYLQGYQLALGKIGIYNRLIWIPKLIYLFAILLLVGLFGLHVKGALLSILVSNLIAILVILKISHVPFPGMHPGRIPVRVIRSLIGSGILYALAFLVTRLNHKVDILLLKRMSDLSEVGYYSLGANVAESLWQVPIAVGVVLMTRSATSVDQRPVTRQVCAGLRISLLVVLACAAVLYAIAPQLVPFLFGKTYAPSVPMIRTILPGVMFFVVLKILNSQFVGAGKPGLITMALVPALVLNIILNYMLIPRYGGVGAALATDISYFAGSAGLVVIYSRTFGTAIGDIFRYRKSDFHFFGKHRS
ncbi:MAG TPA: hypothetical protein ENO20_03680 [Bacteroides sp.]|nr:hypothetical protein [Bacteroides sp.]